jgi:RNA polymerase sigma-54 factor
MAFEMKQSQQLRQELRMTPQLQQAIKLLQLSRLEMADLIQTELNENPLLEELPDQADISTPVERQSERESEAETSDFKAEQTSDSADAERAVQEIDWEAYLENYSSPMPAAGTGGGGRDELPGYDQTLTRSDDLVDHLLAQLGQTESRLLERQLAEVIIHNLDDHGYLRDTTLEEIAAATGVEVDDVEDALLLVQELDPIGVGARDLAECLLIQADQAHPHDKLLREVIRHHIKDLERKDYAGIARALGVTKREIMDAHRTIMTFEPKPGRPFVADDTTYVTPDIYIVRENDTWVARLNEDGLPRLRVSNYYRQALRNAPTHGAPSDDKAQDYVKERLRSAQWLIRSIHQRQRTILRVTEAIIYFQLDFFDRGIDHLRPLVLRDVADHIGMHESTVSRVTTNKYVYTPRGIYELKYFFNSSIKKEGTDDIAAEAVKHHIKQIIAEEKPAKPFSDQKLVHMLHERYGIDIARRTVAKYREMLGILSSSKRKQLL